MCWAQGLYACCNQFSGGLPGELGADLQLVELDLSSNYFSNGIPYTFGSLMQVRAARECRLSRFLEQLPFFEGQSAWVSNCLSWLVSWVVGKDSEGNHARQTNTH